MKGVEGGNVGVSDLGHVGRRDHWSGGAKEGSPSDGRNWSSVASGR